MHDLQTLHSFALSARCRELQVLNSVAAVQQFARAVPEHWYLLGEGSNSIFTEDYQGQVVCPRLQGIEVNQQADGTELIVAAAENWHQLVVWALRQGFYGLENLALIPGSVGAAPVQNIGAYGAELSQFVRWVEGVSLEHNGEVQRYSNAEAEFGYRDSVFKRALAEKFIITKVGFWLPQAWTPQQRYAELRELTDPTPQAIFERVVAVRQQKLPDPRQLGNAGSFFKNPVVGPALFAQLQQQYPQMPHFEQADGHVKIPAAWLLDTLGFKGQRHQGIGCYGQQPLVLVNHGGSGQALLDFAREIRDQVHQHFGILLENEVRLVGQQGLIQL